MASVALANAGFNWPGWVQIWYLALISSELLLVGMWVGFARVNWWRKIAGLIVGSAWLAALAISPVPFWNVETSLAVAGLFVPPMLIVAAGCYCCRLWFARIERRDSWDSRSVTEEMQFTLKSLIGLTIAVSCLLGLGRMVRWIDDGQGGSIMSVFVFSLIAMLMCAMLAWSCLGPGKVKIRVPVILGGVALVGLVFPYYLGGPPWRFVAWPALTLVIAGIVVVSLLVVRSCGYRLVSYREASGT